jgi:tetratricopeptide (TPR) repeat protein
LRKAVAANPDKLEIRLMLAQVLFECDLALALEIADLLRVEIPQSLAPQADFHVSRAANHLGNFADAVAPLRRATDAGVPRARGELATALWRCGDLEGAITAARAALQADPAEIASLRVLGNILLAQDRAEEAYDLAQSLWSHGAHRTQVLWTWASAARALDREREFLEFAAREPWFAQTHLETDADFNALLAEEILVNDTLAVSHSGKPTKGACSGSTASNRWKARRSAHSTRPYAARSDGISPTAAISPVILSSPAGR